MGQDSKIEWTHHTFNPWWGCVKISEGCERCYAEAFSKRTGNAVWGPNAPRRFFGAKHWAEPLKWNSEAQAHGVRHRVFCASMADWLEDRLDLIEPRTNLLELIEATPHLDWLLLSKRPGNWQRLMVQSFEFACDNGAEDNDRHRRFTDWIGGWTHAHVAPCNIWVGATMENQRRWDERSTLVAAIPAQVRFVSAEPLLGPIKMGDWRPDWLIVGGESGGKSRAMEREWVESLRDQCDERTAFFFKQWGGHNKAATGRELDGRTWDALPFANDKTVPTEGGDKRS